MDPIQAAGWFFIGFAAASAFWSWRFRLFVREFNQARVPRSFRE